MARGLFGDRATDAVAIVEAPVSRSFARHARVTFYVVAFALWALVSMVLWTVLDPVRAVGFGLVAGLGLGFGTAALVRVWPVLRTVWHWAAELGLVVVVSAVLVWTSSLVGWLWTATVAVVVVLVLVVVSPVRRRLASWVWCAVVRHRLRLCFAEFVRAANRTHPGRLPLLLWARPTPAGERVWLWLRPGLALSDLEGRADKLAVACWASEVRVVRASSRFAALIRVDVARRDPLVGLVLSPLSVPVQRDGERGAVPVSKWVGLDLPEVPEEEPAGPVRGPGRR